MRGSSLGSSRAVMLNLNSSSGTTTTERWNVDEIIIKYIPRALR
jgi:hypothetical protein